MKPHEPKILVISTDKISDPGIDLAGLMKMHYSSDIFTINVPCSTSIKPKWVVKAIQQGIDGVYIAADGSDCPYRPDCTALTAAILTKSQEKLKALDINPARVKMSAVCSVCAESFVKNIGEFSEQLKVLNQKEGK
jgi:coenzyme F420-reducing hydrogenase delta subunit